MTKVEQTRMLADIKACRKYIFKLCNQHMRLKKQNKQQDAAILLKQIKSLTTFLKKVEDAAFI